MVKSQKDNGLPNTIQVPNLIIDYWLNWLGEIDLKIILFLFRKNFSLKKEKVSLSQIIKKFGFPINQVRYSIEYLIKKELVKNTEKIDIFNNDCLKEKSFCINVFEDFIVGEKCH